MTADQQPRPRGRPRTGRKPSRSIRIGDVWDRCAALAEQDGQTMSDLVDQALVAEERRRLRRRKRTGE